MSKTFAELFDEGMRKAGFKRIPVNEVQLKEMRPQVQKVKTGISEEYRIDDFPEEVLPPLGERMNIYKIRYGRTENIGNCRDYEKGVWQKMEIYLTFNNQAVIESNQDGSITVRNFTDTRTLLNNNQKAKETLLDKLSPEARSLLEKVLKENEKPHLPPPIIRKEHEPL